MARTAEQSVVGLIGKQTADAELVAAARAGDERAFPQLYERYHRPVAAYVRGMVKDHGRAEDITQEVFLSALRRMQATDRPIVFRPWIYEIAKNAAIDQFRRSRRAEEVSYDAEDVLEGAASARYLTTSPGPAAAIDRKESLDQLFGAFGGLSETHHEILVMREFEGLSYQEIGERLGMTGAAVESTLFRARKRLAEEYGELVSGKRCLQVQALLATPRSALGSRDGRRVARHVSHCDPCRRQARLAGLEVAPRRSLRSRVAAFFPLPAVLRRRGDADDAGALTAQATSLSPVSASLSSVAEPLTGWIKAVAVAAAVAIAGTGAGVATHRIELPGVGGLPVLGDKGADRATSPVPPRTGRDGGAPAGIGGPAGVPATERVLSSKAISIPNASTAPDAAGGGVMTGTTGASTTSAGGGPQPAGPGSTLGRAGLGGSSPSDGPAEVPRPREVRQEVRDTRQDVVQTAKSALPKRRDAERSKPLSGVPQQIGDALPTAPATPDPATLAPATSSLPEVPQTPSLPPAPDPGDPLGGILGGVLGG